MGPADELEAPSLAANPIGFDGRRVGRASNDLEAHAGYRSKILFARSTSQELLGAVAALA